MRCPYRLVVRTTTLPDSGQTAVRVVEQEFADCLEDECPFYVNYSNTDRGECERAIAEMGGTI